MARACSRRTWSSWAPSTRSAIAGQLELGAAHRGPGPPGDPGRPADAHRRGGLLDDLPTALACYSIHDPSTEAIAAVIFGESNRRSRAPVDTGALALQRRCDASRARHGRSGHEPARRDPRAARRRAAAADRPARDGRRASPRRCAGRDIDLVLIAARGSSDHAAIYAQYLFGALHRLPVALAAPAMTSVYGVAAAPGARAGHRHLAVGSLAGRGGRPRRGAGAGRADRRHHQRRRHRRWRAPRSMSSTSAPGAERATAATKTYTMSLLAVAMLVAAIDGGTGFGGRSARPGWRRWTRCPR